MVLNICDVSEKYQDWCHKSYISNPNEFSSSVPERLTVPGPTVLQPHYSLKSVPCDFFFLSYFSTSRGSSTSGAVLKIMDDVKMAVMTELWTIPEDSFQPLWKACQRRLGKCVRPLRRGKLYVCSLDLKYFSYL